MLDTGDIEDDDQAESLRISVFIHTLIKDAMKNPSRLAPYTEEINSLCG
jgi:antitoxin PrlF